MKKTYYRPTDNAFQYKWSPDNFSKVKPKTKHMRLREKPICTAKPGTQGVDPVVRYVYQLSAGEHLAYVECDFVQ